MVLAVGITTMCRNLSMVIGMSKPYQTKILFAKKENIKEKRRLKLWNLQK